MLKLGFSKVKKKLQVHSLRKPMRMTGTRLYYIPKIWCDVKMILILEPLSTRGEKSCPSISLTYFLQEGWKILVNRFISKIKITKHMFATYPSRNTFYAHEHWRWYKLRLIPYNSIKWICWQLNGTPGNLRYESFIYSYLRLHGVVNLPYWRGEW